MHKRDLRQKLEAIRSLARTRRRLQDNIKTDFREIIQEFGDWIYVVQDSVKWLAVVNTVMEVMVLRKAGSPE
jgi:hypothetical protein